MRSKTKIDTDLPEAHRTASPRHLRHELRRVPRRPSQPPPLRRIPLRQRSRCREAHHAVRPQRMAKRGMAKNDHPNAPQLLPPTGKRSFLRASFIGKRSYFRADFIGKRTSLQKTHYLCTIKKAVTCCTERLHNGLKNTSLQIQIECC